MNDAIMAAIKTVNPSCKGTLLKMLFPHGAILFMYWITNKSGYEIKKPAIKLRMAPLNSRVKKWV